ncbi:MAG TPA: multidrug efflux SMR transporter [Methanoculleus sp.]|nr:multidrug efflux SMR transporter [Methanoculleus sp.]HPZ32392.1 multidrug efflux SMR transporter [Methanoculleus sp.]HQD23889.1 multidrug efflux SMR transporter [Methanoculleus sp.]HQE10978.1 multidrug efflux SMR transporter [Bacillota bacterium]HUM77047.1 multidrug efflux SMR transporter [Methanoculleus sp.]
MQNGVWMTLFFAGILEAGWAIGLKYTEGFTRVWPSAATLVLMGGSIYLLSRSLTGLPLGTAYAVWTGIGAVGTVIAGLVLFDESRSALRLLCILLIVAGIVGLKLCSDA